MATFTDRIQELFEREAEIVNLKDFKITVPEDMDTVLLYSFLKRLWLEKADKYMQFHFPLINYIEVDTFVVKPRKPWGIVGFHKLTEATITDIE